MLESYLETVFNKGVRKRGGMAIKLQSASRKGVPDRLVLMPGNRFYLVELKTDDGVVSPLQRLFAAKAAKLGIPVAFPHGRSGIDAWLKQLGEVMPNETP